MVVPHWSHCTEYRIQMRRGAICVNRERGYPIRKAFGLAPRHEHHRVEHWVTLLAITRSSASSASGSNDETNKRRQETELQRTVRSRPPPGKTQRRRGQAVGPNGYRTGNTILKLGGDAHKHFAPEDHKCVGEKLCATVSSPTNVLPTPGSREHSCAGRGKRDVADHNCGCLEAKVDRLLVGDFLVPFLGTRVVTEVTPRSCTYRDIMLSSVAAYGAYLVKLRRSHGGHHQCELSRCDEGRNPVRSRSEPLGVTDLIW